MGPPSMKSPWYHNGTHTQKKYSGYARMTFIRDGQVSGREYPDEAGLT